MKTFKQYISERVVNSFDGSNRDEVLSKHGKDLHDMISKSYEYAGGYGGHKTGSQEEHDAIHSDLSNHKHILKITTRNGKATNVNIYKNQHGRKSIGAATDGSKQGVTDFKKTKQEDMRPERHAWAEVSDKAEHVVKKLGAKEVDVKHAAKLTGKEITPTTGNRYKRKIGGTDHEKVIVGNPKIPD